MLADDHTLVLEAFRKLLESRYDVVGTCCNGRALLESAPSLKPDVVIVDIAMPHLIGMETSRLLKQKMPRIKVIFLTMNHDPELAFEAMRACRGIWVCLEGFRIFRIVQCDRGSAERKNVRNTPDRPRDVGSLH
jgi:DNA-binding NarL/FixJ family response regulator